MIADVNQKSVLEKGIFSLPEKILALLGKLRLFCLFAVDESFGRKNAAEDRHSSDRGL